MPNNWKLDAGGKLIKDVETEEFKAAVGFARDLWAAGVWHPNSPTYGGAFNDDFMAGRFAVAPGRLGPVRPVVGHRGAAPCPNAQDLPDAPVRPRRRQAVLPGGLGQFGVTYIKQQASPERVKMLLRSPNYLPRHSAARSGC